MAKEITREELKPTLRHYWRMRKAAYKCLVNGDSLSPMNMSTLIGEDWFGNYCSLCIKYCKESKAHILNIHQCTGCPIKENGFCCLGYGSLWGAMNRSADCQEFIGRLTIMAKMIMKLPREKMICPECDDMLQEDCEVDCDYDYESPECQEHMDSAECEDLNATCETCDGEGEINAR
jgi:hypothetical protein